mgnify:CR=1 FL=1
MTSTYKAARAARILTFTFTAFAVTYTAVALLNALAFAWSTAR